MCAIVRDLLEWLREREIVCVRESVMFPLFLLAAKCPLLLLAAKCKILLPCDPLDKSLQHMIIPAEMKTGRLLTSSTIVEKGM